MCTSVCYVLVHVYMCLSVHLPVVSSCMFTCVWVYICLLCPSAYLHVSVCTSVCCDLVHVYVYSCMNLTILQSKYMGGVLRWEMMRGCSWKYSCVHEFRRVWPGVCMYVYVCVHACVHVWSGVCMCMSLRSSTRSKLNGAMQRGIVYVRPPVRMHNVWHATLSGTNNLM